MNTSELINGLIQSTHNHVSRSNDFLTKDSIQLNKKIGERWSALECFAHLNLYLDYYLPEISAQIAKCDSRPKENFRPGLLGNYFAESMKTDMKKKKMKTPKDKNPTGQTLTKSTFEDFICNLQTLALLLQKSREINLEKVKIRISISKLIKINLGDSFRFLINHNERHLQQAEKALKF